MNKQENGLPRPTQEKHELYLQLQKEGRFDEMIELHNQYDWATEVFEEYGFYGLRSCTGEILAPAIFQDFKLMTQEDVSKGSRVVAAVDFKFGVIRADGSGNWLVKPEYDDIGYPNNITSVRISDKWGVLNTTNGELLLPVEYDVIFNGDTLMFTNGIAFMIKNEKFAVMNIYGEYTEAIFDNAMPGEDGTIEVTINGVDGYIDENGQFTTDYDEAYYAEID